MSQMKVQMIFLEVTVILPVAGLDVIRSYILNTFLRGSGVISVLTKAKQICKTACFRDLLLIFCSLIYCMGISFALQWTGVAAGFHPKQIDSTPNN